MHLHVSTLRKSLAAAGDDGAQILTRGHGYELRIGPDDVDARRFERLLARGRAREALALWRGPALDDVSGEPFAAPEIRRLEELRLAAVEVAIENDLEAGRHRQVVGELDVLVLEEPLHERLHAQRMLALYRSGRQADALAAYRQARAALVAEIGVEPGPELRRLHEAILRHDASLDPPAAERPDPELATPTPLFGRETELEELRGHWRSAHEGERRLVLIAGPRGSGKTRLAAELAAEVRRDHDSVLHASGTDGLDGALAGAEATGRPTLLVVDDASAATRSPLGELVDRLAGLPVLVVVIAEDEAVMDGLPVAGVLSVGPLGADAVAAVARTYTGPGEDVDVPVARLLAESGGLPQRLHRAASEWARTYAVSRVGDAARRVTAERGALRTAEDDLAGDVVALQAANERAELGQPAEEDVVVCPFKGLASFEVEDAAYFFGRERLVAELVARLVGAPLTAIVGASGSGKSSVLRAGLLAALSAGVLPGSESWALALLRPGEHPLRALDEAVAHAPSRGRLVIAVDQFEEAFTACRDESERAAFFDALVASARDSRRRALVLIAVRADYYGRCGAYPELSRLLGAANVLVGPLRRDELRRAIELPAGRAGLRVEAELVDALLDDVEGEPGALPLLSTSLLELWQRREGRLLKKVDYERAGGLHGAVARLAERAYERLDPAQRDLARRILLRLAGEGEGDAVVRRRVPLAELEGEREDVAAVLAVLADDRLVSIGAGEVEVAHEALLREWPRLRSWLEEDAEGRRLHHHLGAAAREWEAADRDPGELYRGARLASVLEWSTAHEAELNATERSFLAESRAASDRSHRRLRAMLAGVAAMLFLAVIAGFVALDQRGSARREATVAEAQRLGARALVENDLDRALLLARQGLALDDSAQTRGNLLAALVKSPAAIGVLRGDGERMWRVELSPDERVLAAGDPAGKVFLFDTLTRRRFAAFRPAPRERLAQWIVQLAFSPDGRHLAVAHDTRRGNVVTVFDSATRRAVAKMTPPSDRFVSALRYSAAGNVIDAIAVTPDPKAAPALFTRFDARTGRRLLGPRPINRRHWSPLLVTSDETRLVTAGKGEVTVRDAATLGASQRFAVGGAASPYPGAYALSSDDRTMAIGDEGGSVRLLDLRSGALRPASDRHGGPVTAVAFTPDGRGLISASEDGDVMVWDVEQGTAVETLSGHANGIASLQVTRDGQTLYTASLDGTVFLWDLAGARRLGQPFRMGTGDEGRPQLALSSDGRVIAMGQDDGAISIVDARTLAKRDPFAVVDTGQVLGIGFLPASRRMVVGGPKGFLALVDTDSGRVIRRLRGQSGVMYTPGISADGRLLATGSDDHTVRLWSLPDGRPLGAPLRFGRGRGLEDAQLSPDGRLLTVVLVDDDLQNGTVEVWDPRTRRRMRRVRVAGQPNPARFSPDGRLLAISFRNGTTQVWSTATWKPVSRDFAEDASGIVGTSISRDGRTLATGSDTGTVRLWDIRTGQAVGAPLPGVQSRPVAPYFTPDGMRLIASYDTGEAYLWDIRPESLARQACAVAGRRLSRDEWADLLPRHAYAPAC